MLNVVAIGLAAGLVVAISIFVARTYNVLLGLFEETRNSFSQIEVQLKRRYDLIPSLVEAARSYLSHERETLEAVISARQQASSKLNGLQNNLTDASAVRSWAASEEALGGAIGRLSMVIEAYPALKANESIAQLTEELTSTENRISFARQLYNDMATQFNIRRQNFPTVLFSPSIGFGDNIELLQFDDHAEIQHAPKFELVGA
ncbi:LemA family protein [Novipirellula galeiformis]|uniref:LemA family protein n=1 Tax=Novipirellula galeiformis TaxID=2528004 RepID=A0A5C6CI85_9BACT|nr:LemA family protein [Novipirellula galeiformis]TWU24138.1 LemA family protein [Novipirellula galeiformis]